MHVVSGYRNFASGALTAVGTNGYAWSSAPQAAGSANGSFLYFNASRVHPIEPNSRTYAFPVRCVQHLQAAFMDCPGSFFAF